MKYYRRELRETLKRPHYKTQSRRMTKGRRTFAIPADRRIEIPGVPRVTQEVMRAIDAKGKAPVIPEYDPEHPEFDPDEYIRRESHSDHARSIETEESVADNLNNIKAAEDATNAGPSRAGRWKLSLCAARQPARSGHGQGCESGPSRDPVLVK
jgi:hypothetical protein